MSLSSEQGVDGGHDSKVLRENFINLQYLLMREGSCRDIQTTADRFKRERKLQVGTPNVNVFCIDSASCNLWFS